MLSDQQLMKLCFTMAVIGVIALFFIVQAIEPMQVVIDDINSDMIGEFVVVSGTADNIYYSEDTLFLELSNNSGKIKVVMFSNSFEVEEISEGDPIKVIGKVSLYKSGLEIIASDIQAIS